MFRLLEISDQAVRLSLTEECLVVTAHSGEVLRRVPLEELDTLLLSNPRVSLTGALLGALGKRRIAVVCCNLNYLPTSCLQPVFVGCLAHQGLLAAQFGLSQPQRKRLWQEIVRRKIQGQAEVLRQYRASGVLDLVYRRVRSGDVDNVESQAAVIYWKTLKVFARRDRFAQDANQFFNYAYTILFAATARYLCAHGLHPQLGLQHCNPHNPFCLASDLMEAYRPLADWCVLALMPEVEDVSHLSAEHRRRLCQALYGQKVVLGKQGTVALFDAIEKTSLGFRSFLLGKCSVKELPLPCFSECHQECLCG